MPEVGNRRVLAFDFGTRRIGVASGQELLGTGQPVAMLPALVSAMAACTWHLFDNSEALRGLVLLQASLTLLGNVVLALAALQLKRRAAT